MKILQIENKTGKLRLTEVVHKESIDRMIDEIGRLFGAKAAAEGADFGVIMNAAENGIDSLEIEINSPGGSVFDGYTMYNEIKSLRERGVDVTATVTGMAASMASVICMACSTVRMVPHARMMIHDAQNAVAGNADKLRSAADLLDGISSDIAAIYASRTGKDMEEIRVMMKKETWMSAKQAVENGFADEVFDIRAESGISTHMNILKVLFPGNEEELSKVEAALAEVDSLRNDLSTATAELETLKADITGKDQVIAEHVATIAAKDEQISNLKDQVDVAVKGLQAKDETIAAKDAEIEEAKATVADQVVQTLASLGQPEPIETEGATETNAVQEYLAAIESGNSKLRSEIFAKHKDEILAYRRKLNK